MFDPKAFIDEKATELTAYVDANKETWLMDVNWLERNAARAGLKLAQRFIEPMVVRVVEGLVARLMPMSVQELLDALTRTEAHTHSLAQQEGTGDA